MNKDSKFICNTFIWDLIVEFYRAPQKKKKVGCNTLNWVISTLFWIVITLQVTRSSRQVSRKENEATYLVVYYNTFIDLHHHCLRGDLMHRYIGNSI